MNAIFGDPVSVLPHVASGRFKALAIAGPKRSSAQPDVPTPAEAGLPDFHVRAWHGVLAPAGVPADVAKKLADAVHAATRDAQVQAALARMGADPADETLEAFGKVIQSEAVKWGEVARQAKFQVD